MRQSFCVRLVHMRGFFWHHRFSSYGARWAGHRATFGAGTYLRRLARARLEGCLGRGWVARPRAPYASRRVRDWAIWALRYTHPHVRGVLPWAGRVLLNLRARATRGARYRLGLPSRGQRTHTNAASAGRVSDRVARYLRHHSLVRRIWTARRLKPATQTQRRPKARPKAAGARAKGRPAVRSKKKLDVWR